VYTTLIIDQKLWGYKVEEKLHLGVREHNELNTTELHLIPPKSKHTSRCKICMSGEAVTTVTISDVPCEAAKQLRYIGTYENCQSSESTFRDLPSGALQSRKCVAFWVFDFIERSSECIRAPTHPSATVLSNCWLVQKPVPENCEWVYLQWKGQASPVCSKRKWSWYRIFLIAQRNSDVVTSFIVPQKVSEMARSF
jgi:hypothetical protein